MNFVINKKKNPRIESTRFGEGNTSCVVFWWLWNTYTSESYEQRISMPPGKIDPIGGGSFRSGYRSG